ncbi:MAG: response regulator, partial [Gemmatimonadaceae bacterium]
MPVDEQAGHAGVVAAKLTTATDPSAPAVDRSATVAPVTDAAQPPLKSEGHGRILVVDDHEDNIEVLRVRLESWGYGTDACYNGHDALAYVEKTPPDLILLDVMMPEISGIEVARRIKGNKSLPFIPIIMQTALDSTEDKVEGLEAGADDYITKPIDFAELKARLRSMLRIKRLQEALEEREKELLEVNERLRFMSQTDALTGLDNRRHLNERIDEMFQ